MEDKNVHEKSVENLKYNMTLTKKGNKFVLFIPELGIVESDDSLENAYQRVELEIKKYIQKMKECGLEDEIIDPGRIGSKNNNPRKTSGVFKVSIAAFIVKVLIVCIIAVMAFSFVADRVETYMTSKVEAVMDRVESNISSRIENIKITSLLGRFLKEEIERLYNKINNLPSAKIEETKIKLRAVVKKIKPLIDELRVIDSTESSTVVEDKPGNNN